MMRQISGKSKNKKKMKSEKKNLSEETNSRTLIVENEKLL